MMASRTSNKYQTLVTISLLELPSAIRKEGNHLANLPVALFSDKKFDINSVLAEWTAEIDALKTGVSIYSAAAGHNLIVFGYPIIIMGDYPARQAVGGFLKSPQSTYPCSLCEIDHKRTPYGPGRHCPFGCVRTENNRSQLVQVQGRLVRNLQLFRGPYIAPLRTRQSLENAWSINPAQAEIFLKKGTTTRPTIADWTSLSFPNCISLDLMHQQLSGEFSKHLKDYTQSFLSLRTKDEEAEWWYLINQSFDQLCRLNNIDVLRSIRDFDSFKHQGAYTALVFSRFFPTIASSLADKKLSTGVDVFRPGSSKGLLFLDHCHILNRLSGTSFLPTDIEQMERDCYHLMTKLCLEYSDCSMNRHQTLHWAQMIRMFGPPRGYSCFRYELKIKWIKTLYTNTNGQNIALSMMKRIMLFLGNQFIRTCSSRLENGEMSGELVLQKHRRGPFHLNSSLYRVKKPKRQFAGRNIRPGSFLCGGINDDGAMFRILNALCDSEVN